MSTEPCTPHCPAGDCAGCAFPPKRRQRNDGLRTLEGLRERCVIDDITHCWNYGGGTTTEGLPSIWFPPLQIRTTPGVILCWLETGKRPAAGVVWHRTCDSLLCCNPGHRKAGTRRTQMQNAAITRTPLERAKIAKGRRALSKLNDAAVADIRESADKLADCAARHGISVSHVSRIRRGELWRPVEQGASVFSLGSAR